MSRWCARIRVNASQAAIAMTAQLTMEKRIAKLMITNSVYAPRTCIEESIASLLHGNLDFSRTDVHTLKPLNRAVIERYRISCISSGPANEKKTCFVKELHCYYR